jgi:hypothetical protein
VPLGRSAIGVEARLSASPAGAAFMSHAFGDPLFAKSERSRAGCHEVRAAARPVTSRSDGVFSRSSRFFPSLPGENRRQRFRGGFRRGVSTPKGSAAGDFRWRRKSVKSLMLCIKTTNAARQVLENAWASIC